MNTFFAYQTRYSEHIWVKPGGFHEEQEAMHAPSVIKVAKHIEAVNLDEATGIAKRRFAAGEVVETHAGKHLRQAQS